MSERQIEPSREAELSATLAAAQRTISYLIRDKDEFKSSSEYWQKEWQKEFNLARGLQAISVTYPQPTEEGYWLVWLPRGQQWVPVVVANESENCPIYEWFIYFTGCEVRVDATEFHSWRKLPQPPAPNV